MVPEGYRQYFSKVCVPQGHTHLDSQVEACILESAADALARAPAPPAADDGQAKEED